MTLFVLDASITMRWFFEAGSHAEADAVLGRLASSADTAVVPTIWCYEVSSVLARAQAKGMIPPQDVADFFKDLAALPIHVEQDENSRIFGSVHGLATAYRLTTDDAAYLELAQRRQLPLATLDAEPIAACANAGVARL